MDPVIQVFASSGKAVAQALFAIELQWPSTTPNVFYEEAWTASLDAIKEGVREALVEKGVQDEKTIHGAITIAQHAFFDRFDALNAAWMAEKAGSA